MGLCLAASLMNYGQTRRKESRHKYRHLCGVVRRVVTLMAEKGRHPSREAGSRSQTGQQKHIETDKYNRSTLSVRQGSEKKWS